MESNDEYGKETSLEKIALSTVKTLNNIEMQKSVMEMHRKMIANFAPLIATIHKLDFERIREVAQILQKGLSDGRDYQSLLVCCMDVLYKHSWFPSMVYMLRIGFFIDLIDIMNTTKEGSKNRGKRINGLVYQYVDKDTIEEAKRSCRKNTEISPCYKKLILEAYTAYQNRKYGTTVIVLAMLWQGMISEKVNNRMYQEGDKIKDYLNMLVMQNDEFKINSEFFDEFIFYDCSGYEKVKDDVPGRHGIAHGWMKKYPTKKAALNAILFTEFLLNLQPLKKENK